MVKKFILAACALLIIAICMPLSACAQTRILSDFPSGEGVEKVFISKTMLNLGMPRKEFFKYGNMFGEVQGMEVYNCDNSSLIPVVESKVDDLLKKYHAEVMLESEDGGERSMIYTLFESKKKDKTVGMAIINYEGKEVNIVIMHGDILVTQ